MTQAKRQELQWRGQDTAWNLDRSLPLDMTLILLDVALHMSSVMRNYTISLESFTKLSRFMGLLQRPPKRTLTVNSTCSFICWFPPPPPPCLPPLFAIVT